MHDKLDNVELVVVGFDVGLVQGAVIVLIDLRQAMGWGGTGGSGVLHPFWGHGVCVSPLHPPSIFTMPQMLFPTLTCASGPALRGHCPSMVAGGFSLGAAFKAVSAELQASSSSSCPPLAFLPPSAGWDAGGARRLGAMGQLPPWGFSLRAASCGRERCRVALPGRSGWAVPWLSYAYSQEPGGRRGAWGSVEGEAEQGMLQGSEQSILGAARGMRRGERYSW